MKNCLHIVSSTLCFSYFYNCFSTGDCCAISPSLCRSRNATIPYTRIISVQLLIANFFYAIRSAFLLILSCRKIIFIFCTYVYVLFEANRLHDLIFLESERERESNVLNHPGPPVCTISTAIFSVGVHTQILGCFLFSLLC